MSRAPIAALPSRIAPALALALALGAILAPHVSAQGGPPADRGPSPDSQGPSQAAGQPAAAAPAPSAERTVWYFYRVKWGAQDEFLDLFQRNHYPVLKAQLGTRLTAIRTYVPTYHGDGRADWTFAVALTFKDTATMTGPSPDAEIARRLYPDQEKFRKEEQRRFELLDAHWDVPLSAVDLESRTPVTR